MSSMPTGSGKDRNGTTRYESRKYLLVWILIERMWGGDEREPVPFRRANRPYTLDKQQ
jgi:hypothetical protein